MILKIKLVMISFLEHALVHGNFYGTSKDFVETKIAEGTNIIGDRCPRRSAN